ncbi:MAG: S-layer homology domain-containing protein [Oscillospiraceae bacterium]|nr:S-layer homology domain-containing protein [Oscillospiraceae bacterium]
MKRILAVLLTAALTVSVMCQTAVFAAFSDVEDKNPYKEAITALTKLSVIDGYEDNTFKPDNTITRAEFTKIIVFTLGYQNLTHNTYAFTDVSEDHWGRNYIQTAYNLGIISGFGDGIFAPDEPVTYEQALKMVVCTLGYEQFAQEQESDMGNWSAKYIREASTLGLMDKISDITYYLGAPRGVIAQVIYNALEIEIYEQKGIASSWIKTEKTLLKDYLKAAQVKGRLVGVGDNVTEDCTRVLGDYEMDILTQSGEDVIINYSSVTENSADIIKYLGNTITVYYRETPESDDNMLIIINDEITKNSYIELDYNDIDSLSGTSFKYYDKNSKIKTVKLREKDLTVRYNGKTVAANSNVTLTNPVTKAEKTFSRQEALEQWLNPDSDYFIYGDVKLTDSGSDNIIDMIQINNYETIVAHAKPTTADYRVTDKLVTGNYIILNPQSSEYEYTITKDGAQIPVTSIAANDVILYTKSLDGSLYTLLVSSKTVKGSITTVSSNKNRMTIDGKEYTIGRKCAEYIRDKDNKEIKAGISGTFYLDALGTAVYGTIEQTAASPYAYIANAFIDYDEGGKAYVTVYAPNVSASSTASYPLKSKIKLNGSNVDSDSAIDRLRKSATYVDNELEYSDKIYGVGKEPNITEYAQPARVTVQNGEITSIITLTSDEIKDVNNDSDQLVKCKNINAYTFSSNSFTQNGKTAFSVNSSTTVIYVPANRTEKTKYAKKTVSSAFTSGDTYYVEAYDINSSKIAGLVILYGNDGSLTSVKKDTDFSVVASLPEEAYNEVNEDVSIKFDVFAGTTGTAKSWMTYDMSEFRDIKVGDVIQFAYDSDNLIQGRINNIRFSDIAAVLDGEEYNGQKYSWAEEITPSEDNHYQKYKFDYRFKKSGSGDDEMYTSSTLGTIPYSRACMYNVSQVLPEEKKIYVTIDGFEENENGLYVLDDSNYEEITISSSTKILRMEDDREEISKYAADTETAMTINDLRDAKNYGEDCSKILVCSSKGTAKMIVVYN